MLRRITGRAAGGEEGISSLALVPGLDFQMLRHTKERRLWSPDTGQLPKVGWGSPSRLAVLRPLPFPVFPPELRHFS